MNQLGARLRDERQRLRLTQLEFCVVGGVGPLAQSRYELGERIPRADYLAKVAHAGVDILYVVTGARGSSLRGDGGVEDTLSATVHETDLSMKLREGLEIITATVAELELLLDQRDVHEVGDMIENCRYQSE